VATQSACRAVEVELSLLLARSLNVVEWIDSTTTILDVEMDLSEVLKGDPIAGVDLEAILSIH
jgi:hypothetical protein